MQRTTQACASLVCLSITLRNVFSDVLFDVLSDVLFDVLCGVLCDVLSDVLPVMSRGDLPAVLRSAVQ